MWWWSKGLFAFFLSSLLVGALVGSSLLASCLLVGGRLGVLGLGLHGHLDGCVVQKEMDGIL